MQTSRPAPRNAELTIPSYRTGPATLITARSYLVDRIVPDCEIVALPEKTVVGGTLRSGLGDGTLPARPSRGRLRLRRAAPAPERIEGRILFDARHHDPSNWAHILNNHLPTLFRLMRDWGLEAADLLVVLPGDAPDHIRAAVALFGIEALATDAALEGMVLGYEVEPWTAVRAIRADWVCRAAPVPATAETPVALPGRAFLARRDTRKILNMEEVEAVLAPLGFATIHAEDLPAPEQMRLFREAEAIVAIHGAALAPLLYRPAEAGPCSLVEILPCGHMTDVYRVMAEQVSVSWIGVRGKLKPDYVCPAYELGAGFKQFSLDDFEVDPEALKQALHKAGIA